MTTNSSLFSNNLNTNNKQIVGSESTNVYLGNDDVTEVFFQMNDTSYKLTDILNSTRTTNLEFNLSTEFQDTFNILDGHQNSFIFGNLVVIDMMYNYNNKREDEFWDNKFSINVRLAHRITGIITSWNGNGYATMEIYPEPDGSNKSICNIQGIGRLNTGYCQFHAIGIK